MGDSEIDVVTKPESTTELTDLGELELDALNSMMTDASEAIQRYSKFQQTMQQAQQGLQQAHADLAGLSKAMEKFIQVIVKTHGYVGTYVYDKENKRLILKE